MAATTTLYGSSRFASSSSSTLPRWSYDVFLSFRGEDTRKNFTDHLYAALVQAGIHTFIDDDELPRGHDISSALLKSIEESRISIVVFSTNYASSRWCLDELVKIIECKNTLGQLVLPIFYHVDPSNVRNKTGCFGEAFGRHEKLYVDEMERVEVRRAALTEAANLAGWDIPNIANWYEAKLIRKVVKEVSCKLKRTFLNVAKHPVGIESRVVHINLLLSIASDDVRMIGIYGLGGIGKTTIAKAVYNHIFLQFEGCCFLANVRECARQSNGLARLQERLLFALLGTKNLKIDSVDRGIILMKERLHSKKVLIVLDDVDHSSQLDTLAGNHDWFGPGSRIIITTRDEHLLKGLKVDERYMAKELNDEESLQLFSLHAMGETNPLENYADLGNGIVRYASGLPLALEVLGSHLFDVNMVLWKSAFDELQQIPHDDIQKKLKISFDALGNGKFKDIFLDIACFFIGMDKDCAITILNACDLCAEYGIYMLISRCLLKINEQNKLTMHDLLRDMGREIVRQESPKELGKRSRLWFHGDVLNVLGKNKGTEKIEGVILTGLPMLNMIQWSNKAFAGMHKLRLLQINHVHLSGNFEHLFEELRWLCWHNCPLEYLPSNFHPEKLVVLNMQFSRFKTLRIDGKHFRSLKFLNLSNSKCLTKSPIFCALPMLEELLLESCTGLMELHESIGLLDKLVHLNLKDCMNLGYLPGIICKLKSVKRLNLTGCAKLEEFPEHLGCMESLTELLTDGTAIKQLPFSIGLLKNLRSLSLKGCNRQLTTKSWFSLISSWVLPRKNPNSIRLLPSSVSGLCSLTELDLRDCNLSEEDFPINFGSLSSLRALDLGGNDFCILPYGFSHLSKLENLNLNNCRSLQSISGLPPNLLVVNAEFCASLEKISSPSIGLLDKLVHLNLEGCMNLRYLLGSFCNLKSLEHLNIAGCAKLKGFRKHGGHVESLTVLIARTGLKKLPPLSMGLLTNLRSLLWNRYCKQFTIKNVDAKLIEMINSVIVDRSPSVKWEDIAGLEKAKQALLEMVILPTKRRDLFTGLRRPARGLLLFGPPGTGKTMLAKAVSSESEATFFNVSASSLTSKWVGEGEKLVRALFMVAVSRQPSVIFMDEIDSIMSTRMANEHDASRRLKSEFLVQFDGVTSNSDDLVIVIGATNKPQELDDAVLRRLVKRIYIPLPDARVRRLLLKHKLKGQAFSLPAGDLERLVEETEGYSGSDLQALCEEAAMMPIRELGANILTIEANQVRPLRYEDFHKATTVIRPSLHKSKWEELEQWNREFGSN